MEALLAKAALHTHVTLGITMLGKRHGVPAMQQAATVFHELWMKEDGMSDQTATDKNEK